MLQSFTLHIEMLLHNPRVIYESRKYLHSSVSELVNSRSDQTTSLSVCVRACVRACVRVCVCDSHTYYTVHKVYKTVQKVHKTVQKVHTLL